MIHILRLLYEKLKIESDLCIYKFSCTKSRIYLTITLRKKKLRLQPQEFPFWYCAECISLACSSTDRRFEKEKKINIPHTDDAKLKLEHARSLKLSPYWRESPIVPTLTYVKVQSVRGYTCCPLLFFYLQFSWRVRARGCCSKRDKSIVNHV